MVISKKSEFFQDIKKFNCFYHKGKRNYLNKPVMKTITTTTTILILLMVSFANAQNENINQKIKYVTNAPDGSVAFTITDDQNKTTLILNASNAFYKYEVLDKKTARPLLSSMNKGRVCTIDKTRLGKGDYNLRLYNKNFVITAKLTILQFKNLNKIWENENPIALNKRD